MENKEKKSLDKYFELAKKEEVKYSKDDTKKLIVKYSTAGTVGFISSWWFKTLFDLKIIGFATASLITSFAVYYSFFHNQSNSSSKKAAYPISSNIVNNENIKSVIADYLKEETIASLNKQRNNTKNINSNITTNINVKSSEDNEKESNNDVGNKQNNSNDYYALSQSQYKDNTSNSLLNLCINSTLHNLDLFPTIDNKLNENDPNELKTIVFHFSKKNSYSVTGVTKYSKVLGKSALLVGGKILWTMNDKVSLGLSGYGNTTANKNNFTFTDKKNESVTGYFTFGYGAFDLEYILNPDDLVKFSLMSNIGIGSYKLRSNVTNANASIPWASFYLFEPGLNMEIEINDFIHVGCEASYRYSKVFQSEKKFNNSTRLRDIGSGFISGGLFLKIGLF